MIMTRRTALSLSAATARAVPASARDGYPNRPVRIVVPFPAGGSVDPPARVLADALSNLAGQRFVVDNRPGQAGNIGSDDVAKAEPDGYTLLASNNSMTISQSLYAKLPWDATKDFTWNAARLIQA